ncbi:MAG: M15 family metallopeptidase [Firmicutes bacterium]|nr:M15 family metallopeptidase [Bacillota bacterium]
MARKYAGISVRICAALMLTLAAVLCGRGLWEKWYSPLQEKKTEEFVFSDTVLVNAEHPIPMDYVPQLVPADHIFLCPAAAASWDRLVTAAQKQGYSITAVLGYCSPEESAQTDAENSSGLRQSCRAPARQNEHNLGLAVDIRASDDGLEWLRNHMSRYGFILRYPKNKESVTGTAEQPLHLRYVGTQAAKIMSKKKITLEEYQAVRQ